LSSTVNLATASAAWLSSTSHTATMLPWFMAFLAVPLAHAAAADEGDVGAVVGGEFGSGGLGGEELALDEPRREAGGGGEDGDAFDEGAAREVKTRGGSGRGVGVGHVSRIGIQRSDEKKTEASGGMERGGGS
jgi:hypothetical protein